MPGMSFPSKPLEYGSYRWFQSQIGRTNPDVGADPDSFSKGARQLIHDIINRGARRVYVLDNFQDGVTHKWSFLTTRFELQIKSGVSEYKLPDDCGSVQGNLSFDNADSGYTPVMKTTVGNILGRRSVNSTVSSYPQMYAETFSQRDGSAKQNRLLMVWPDPGGDYTLNGMMDINPTDLDEKHPFPYGGDPLVETHLASMLSLLDPNQEKLYQQRLRAAMMHDLGHSTPEFLGKNNNGRSTSRHMEDGRFVSFDPVTYSV